MQSPSLSPVIENPFLRPSLAISPFQEDLDSYFNIPTPFFSPIDQTDAGQALESGNFSNRDNHG